MIDRADIVEMLRQHPLDRLLVEANQVRREACGDEVHLRGVIEFSNVCERSCYYCARRAANTRLRRYKMTADDMVDAARSAHAKGFRTIVLQSGENSALDIAELCGVISEIKSWHDTAVTLAIGLRDSYDYTCLRSAGADRFILKEETLDETVYSNLHDGAALTPRILSQSHLKNLGFETGGGIIVGLPGQTPESIAKSIFTARDLSLDMFDIGPLIPSADTPLAQTAPGDLELTLRAIAAARITLRDVHLSTTAVLNRLPGKGFDMELLAGANVVMSDVTPSRYRVDTKAHATEGYGDSDSDMRTIDTLCAAIRRAGRMPGSGVGRSYKLPHTLRSVGPDSVMGSEQAPGVFQGYLYGRFTGNPADPYRPPGTR